MKKFILLFSLTSCLFLTSLNAQVIDSIVISQPIECPGGRGDFVVYTTPCHIALRYCIAKNGG